MFCGDKQKSLGCAKAEACCGSCCSV